MAHVARDLTKAFDALAALLVRVMPMSRHRDSRHAEEEARIDAVIAGLDALAGEHAGARPFARGFRTVPRAQNVDDAIDHGPRLGLDTARPGHRADLDAFAATGAGI